MSASNSRQATDVERDVSADVLVQQHWRLRLEFRTLIVDDDL